MGVPSNGIPASSPGPQTAPAAATRRSVAHGAQAPGLPGRSSQAADSVAGVPGPQGACRRYVVTAPGLPSPRGSGGVGGV